MMRRLVQQVSLAVSTLPRATSAEVFEEACRSLGDDDGARNDPSGRELSLVASGASHWLDPRRGGECIERADWRVPEAAQARAEAHRTGLLAQSTGRGLFVRTTLA